MPELALCAPAASIFGEVFKVAWSVDLDYCSSFATTSTTFLSTFSFALLTFALSFALTTFRLATTLATSTAFAPFQHRARLDLCERRSADQYLLQSPE